VPFAVGTRETLAELRANAWWLLVVAVVNTAIPFWLLAWGETRIDSGLASIVQGGVPIFNAVIAFAFFRESRVTGLRLVGIAVGFVGVALLVGAQPSGKVLGALAVVGMALCYAVGGLLMRRYLRDVRPIVIALASCAVSALIALPAGILQAPRSAPGWKEIGSVVALAVIGTALAQIILYRVLRSDGAAKVSLVTYLLPATALVYGVLLLGEPLTWEELAGMALILGGVALGSGAIRFARREPVAAPTP
jgi:drug/metabolite transporter (DMT)-like permease